MIEKYYSQIGQDRFVDEFLNKKENGIFIDIGASNGETHSNSKFFEEFRNWKGICIEPGINEFNYLIIHRKSININACISDYDGESEFTYIIGNANMLSGLTEGYNESHSRRVENESKADKIEKIKIPVYKLQTILDKNNIYNIDYCSIDVEGVEFNVIKSIDFSKTNIKIFSIENNYNTNEIKNYLEKFNYKLYKKLQWDDIFIKEN